jgi:hypothetical protein
MADLSGRAVVQEPEDRSRGGLKDRPHFWFGHGGSGVKGDVSGTMEEVDDHEEFSAGGESGAKRKLGWGKVSQSVACGRDGSADSDEQQLRWPAVAGHGSANGSGIDSAIGYGGSWRAGQSSECVRNWRAERATRSDVEIHPVSDGSSTSAPSLPHPL